MVEAGGVGLGAEDAFVPVGRGEVSAGMVGEGGLGAMLWGFFWTDVQGIAEETEGEDRYGKSVAGAEELRPKRWVRVLLWYSA